MRATDKRIELLPPQLNAREIRLDGVFTRDRKDLAGGTIRLATAVEDIEPLTLEVLEARRVGKPQ
jgi:hypothetical protein